MWLNGASRGRDEEERDGELGGWPRFCFVLGRAETEAEGGKEENGNRGPATDPEVIGWEDPFQRIKRGMQGKSGIKEKKREKKRAQVTHSHTHTQQQPKPEAQAQVLPTQKPQPE